MKISLLLHIYQPSTQFPEITKKAVEVSYLPIINLLEKNSKGKITLNIAGSLTEQLANLGNVSVLEKFKELEQNGQVEFVGSAKYHPLLPEIPQSEVSRQIELNKEVNRNWLGKSWQAQGFFLPEMAYSLGVKEVLIKAGYKWVLLDESAHPEALVAEKRTAEEEAPVHERLQIGAKTFIDPSGKMRFLFRDRERSLEVAYAKVETVKEFLQSIPSGRFSSPEQYTILAMDGETFGFHHPEMLKFLEELFLQSETGQYELTTVSEILKSGYPEEIIEPRTSTWGTTIEEEKRGLIFPRWNNPQNPVHQLQWQLLRLALSLVSDNPQASAKARDYLDKGLQSDQFWWASHNPCWHPPMIEKGAKLLMAAINESPASIEIKHQGYELYDKIVNTGRELYGDRVIAC